MNGLLEKTARRLEPLRGKTLALGVSGGRDSMCLLHAALNCGAVEKSQLLAVHVNHGLRDQADSDELFVREFCLRNGVEFRAYRVNVKAESAKNGFTIEQAARNLRYAVFYDLIGNGEADVVLTAHHALDNAETVLMHLFRGAGLDGMRGMADGGTLPVVRPFLDVYPFELDEYCAQNGLKFVVDDTNFLDDADRNYIRLNVIPLIERRYKGAVRAINALSAECARACDYMESSIDPVVNHVLRRRRFNCRRRADRRACGAVRAARARIFYHGGHYARTDGPSCCACTHAHRRKRRAVGRNCSRARVRAGRAVYSSA